MNEQSVAAQLIGRREDSSKVIHITQSTLRVVVANLIREPENPKFHVLRPTKPRIAEALTLPGVESWLLLCGFQKDAEGSFVFRGTVSDALAAERVLSRVESELIRSAGDPVSHASDRLVAQRDLVRSEIAMSLREKEDETAELLKRKDLEGRQSLDYAEAAHLFPVARKTIHFTGRLRNSFFSAEPGVTIRTMRHGRSCACLCPPENLEVHWHVKSGSILYSNAVHLSHDASTVVHTCPEYGYQYQSLPDSPLFKLTLLTSIKTVRDNGEIDCTIVEKPATSCEYCQKSFSMLWV